MTQEALAWSCDLAKPFLSQIEAGKRLPSLTVLVSLAKQIGVEPADLLVLDTKNPRLRLLEAVRKDDAGSVLRTLAGLGYPVPAGPKVLRVAEPGQKSGRGAPTKSG
jgi:DNA-binding XRE family transcriptional regulator